MNFKSQKIPLLILGITSLVCSRTVFFFINDPEGPNLLVVIVLAAIIYFLSLAVYVFAPLTLVSSASLKRLVLAIFMQILLVAGFYFLLIQ